MRVLVVSPHFPPTNAADMQRIRLLLPHWKDFGIEAQVLAVEPTSVASPVDPWLLAGLPVELRVHRVKGLGRRFCGIPGLGTLPNRAFYSLRKAGDRFLALGKKEGNPFDIVYFSTTQFGIHRLGPYWKRKFGVPFVLDYQDPWVNDYYQRHPQVVPPGGRLKYAIAHRLAMLAEPRVLKVCSGITSVSSAYPEQLRKRYPFLKDDFPVLVVPFPGDIRDIDRVKSDVTIKQSVFDPDDGLIHWVYIGRGGDDMHTALRALFHAVQAARRDMLGQEGSKMRWIQRLRLHFVGTSYASSGKGLKTISPVATEFGLGDIVVEHTDRIPYSETLRCLLDANALLVFGSNDPGYTASKIYPYLLVEKPLLAIFHQLSSVVSLIEEVGGGTLVKFGQSTPLERIAGRVKSAWFDAGMCEKPFPLDYSRFTPYMAREQALAIATHFERCLCS